MTDNENPDYQGYYHEHLAHLFEDEDGELNRDLIQRELYDYRHVLAKFIAFLNFATGGKVSDPRLSLDILQKYALNTATLTAKAAIIQALLELQEDINDINGGWGENNRLDPALDLIALYLVSLGHSLDPEPTPELEPGADD